MKTSTKIILLTSPLLLIVLTYLYGVIISNGLNVHWKLVGKPAENISKIIGYNVGKLYFYSDSGIMYSLPYYPWSDPDSATSNWVEDNSYKKELDPIYDSRYKPHKILSLPPPFRLKQIYQFDYSETESTKAIKFALSDDGNLWYWSVSGSGLQGFFFFLILAFEVLVYVCALFVFCVVFLLMKKVKRKSNFQASNR